MIDTEERQKTFERHAWALGPRLVAADGGPISSELEIWRRMLAQLVEDARRRSDARGSLPEFHLEFIDSQVHDAIVFEASNVAYVGVTFGLAFGFRKMFHSMLATRDALAHVGDSVDEQYLLATLPPHSTRPTTRELPSTTEPEMRMVIARDPMRRETAETLAVRVMTVVLSHAVAHVAHGHVAFIGTRTGVPTIVERRKSGAPVTDAERWMIEFDADCVAISSTFRDALVRDTRRIVTGLVKRVSPVRDSYDEVVYNAVFALAAYHSHTHLTDKRLVERTSAHRSSLHSLLSIEGIVTDAAARHFDAGEISKVQAAVQSGAPRAMRDAMDAVAGLLGVQVPKHQIREALRDYIDVDASFKSTWDSISPDLDQRAHVDVRATRAT